MKILLIYYTGTFNTRFLSKKVKERFLSRGDEVDIVEITSTTPCVDTNEYDLIGFSYPIYGFNAPLPFDNYVKKLKFKKGQKYFIYKNSGETLANTMKKFKSKLIGEYHYVMPYNIHFPFERDFIREILVYNEKLLDIMFYNFDHDVVFKIKSNSIYNVGAFFVGIQKIGGNINSFLYKVDKDKCINCN